MLIQAIDLDAQMPAGAVLERLARNGYWLDASHDAARERIEDVSRRLARPLDEVARRLARDASRCGAAIRRQWGVNVLWYARELKEVLVACCAAAPGTPLGDALGLHESSSEPPIDGDGGAMVSRDGVVMMSGMPVAVSLREGGGGFDAPHVGAIAGDWVLRGEIVAAAPAPVVLQAWPRIDAPDFKAAGEVFEVVVGFGTQAQEHVSGGVLSLPFPADTQVLDLVVELSAGRGIEAPEGWSRPLRVTPATVATAQVTFTLRGLPPDDVAGAWLTLLEVRYLLSGTVCGTAARPLAILPAASHAGGPPAPASPAALPPGAQPWIGAVVPPTPFNLVADPVAPDLTIEISKPDRAPGTGLYVCRLSSPHPLATVTGPFQIDLGDDAKTFARAMVDEVRQFSGDALLAKHMEGVGRLVANRLPGEVFEALAEVEALVRPQPPAVLLVSVESHVPWELAWMDVPFDSARPSFVGAQTLMGRWQRDGKPPRLAAGAAPRPPAHPVSVLDVRHMATMSALYGATSGLRRLPMAEAEVQALSTRYPGIKLSATAQQMNDLLDAALRSGAGPLAVQAVHLAGHGDFDPTRPDASALYLEDGKALHSTLFRAARYGGSCQPLLFLNACMLGIGGDLLGDMAGFPGSSLRGGFGGVLGALWEVDDAVAHDIALEFWRRALPDSPGGGETIGSILRDVRAGYQGHGGVPVATCLAYVYYGHPRLTLRRLV